MRSIGVRDTLEPISVHQSNQHHLRAKSFLYKM